MPDSKLEFTCQVFPWGASLFFILPYGRSQHRSFNIETKLAGLGGALLEMVECLHLAICEKRGQCGILSCVQHRMWRVEDS